ncbi:TetR/AcrR family transcriptional regulator C-terminal domain-containing protein [Bacillus sp. NEB1478]|uniref:TetR/AcrR family transcriptional regulator C-terminal domain-containing protein n=1 Tax=Bacillus sp. NEB1478 TaxID=3073816 RepID=UPI00287388FC|nr:TetR/AcrR family transcriptional regulator C-terminal domain-containing protein [Bacillus sp. NEB1478]WNB93892.1 TetR/AcrR family transcriptional regulator C-terminal domain-containing protein [Bacillus sp. NEB1478]
MEIQIDKEHIIQAALKLLNQSGIHSLSMRKLADQLGIKASSIYWHVKNKSELLQLLAERITEKISYPGEPFTWDKGLKVIANNYLEVLLSYRDSAEIMMITPPFTPNRLSLIEFVYSLFIKAGIPKEEIQSAASLFNNYILSFVMDEVKIGEQDQLTDLSKMQSFKDAEKYPLLASVHSPEKEQDMIQRFQWGLEVLISGFKSIK